ncbi:MAG: hypothetical protein JSW50_00065, partial [Candidatus Latescibacterota bacterium]
MNRIFQLESAPFTTQTRGSALRILLRLSLLLCAFTFFTTEGFSQCYAPDAPDCPCFNHTGAWNPGVNPQAPFIQDVAHQTMGTEESCGVKDGGKPYYQMVRGATSRQEATMLSAVLDPFLLRPKWCSETISFWHREANIPHPSGYRANWNSNWQMSTINELKAWYLVEQSLVEQDEGPKGRGRWIDGVDLDYENFVLGKTVPVPGAYIATRGYNAIPFPMWDSDTSHSQMIDEMWIHKDRDGKVIRIEVTLLQGNVKLNGSPGIVCSGHLEDLLRYTAGGSDWLSNNKKIYGFGIDLDSNQQP